MSEIIPEVTDALRAALTDSRSPFTAEDRIAVVMAYLVTGGNSARAAKISAIPGRPLLQRGTERGGTYGTNRLFFGSKAVKRSVTDGNRDIRRVC